MKITFAAAAVVGLLVHARAAGQEPAFVEVAPGERLAVTQVGDGHDIVIVPGMLGSSYGFRHVTPRLVEAGYSVTIIEPLGTGASSMPKNADYSFTAQAERLAAVFDTLGITQPLLVCHSASGSTCLRLAYRRPERVAGIVSINGGPAERAASDNLRRALKLRTFIKFFTGAGFVRNKVRDGLIASSADPAWVTPETLEGYLAPYDGNMDRVIDALQRMASASEPEALQPNLSRIDAPVLLLVGPAANGSGVPDDQLATLVEHAQELRVDTIPAAGLYIHEEQPHAVTQAILAMLEEVLSPLLPAGLQKGFR